MTKAIPVGDHILSSFEPPFSYISTMSKVLLTVAALVGSASAFAPARQATSVTSLNEFAGGLVGGEGPEPIPITGPSTNWDPCGFAEV